MKALSERWVTGWIAAAILPPALLALRRAAGETMTMSAVEYAVSAFYFAAVYWTVGTAAAVVADWWISRLVPTGHRAVSYVAGLATYAVAGFGVALLLALALYGRPPSASELVASSAWAGVPAALLYYHVSRIVRAIGGRLHGRAYGVPLETERLVLQPLTKERYREALSEGYPVGNHVKSYMASLERQPRLLGWGVWLVRSKEAGGAIVGDAGFKGNPDATGAVDIGYGFLPQHRGKGYATEAAGALVGWAFAHGAGRVTAETLRDNAASIRVLRKSGFRLYREDEHYYWRLDAVDRLRGV
ncbi:GNAT family N-acetyltransferase [Paenibacillus sp. TRM 82003]|nr:GNAT family N-acetyltransferase [Paenibacillus sp. TRM 82003]